MLVGAAGAGKLNAGAPTRISAGATPPTGEGPAVQEPCPGGCTRAGTIIEGHHGVVSLRRRATSTTTPPASNKMVAPAAANVTVALADGISVGHATGVNPSPDAAEA